MSKIYEPKMDMKDVVMYILDQLAGLNPGIQPTIEDILEEMNKWGTLDHSEKKEEV